MTYCCNRYALEKSNMQPLRLNGNWSKYMMLLQYKLLIGKDLKENRKFGKELPIIYRIQIESRRNLSKFNLRAQYYR